MAPTLSAIKFCRDVAASIDFISMKEQEKKILSVDIKKSIKTFLKMRKALEMD